MKEKISILLIGFMLMFSGCGKQDVQVYYWDNEGNDVLTSKMKTDSQSENGFARNFLEKYDGLQLDFIGNFPARDSEDYIFQRESYEDYIKISYRDNVDYYTDGGIQYYDLDGHILYWEHYLTSGDRNLYFVWENDKVKWIVDTGGMSFGTDPEDSTIYTGIYTQLYYFEPAISREELTDIFVDI